jgi:hypothetical protein
MKGTETDARSIVSAPKDEVPPDLLDREVFTRVDPAN